MNKKMLVVLAVLIAVAAGVVAMRESGSPVAPQREILGAEAALPKFDGDENHVLLKVVNVEGLRKGVQMLRDFMPVMSDPDVVDEMRRHYDAMKDLGAMDPVDSLEKFDLAVKYVTLFDAFFTAADEIAFLGASPDLCMAFFTNEEKFAAMKAAFEREREASEPWDTELATEGEEAWIVRDTLPAFDDEEEDTAVTLYVLKRADEARTQVLVAGSEETMKRAVRAWESPADRAAVTRRFEAPNFLQYRFDAPAFGGSSRDMAVEMAWQRAGDTTTVDTFTDLSAWGATPATSGTETQPLPLYGSGEPFFLMTVDLAYFFSIGMPGAENPAEQFVSLIETAVGQQIPFQFRSDVLAVLSGSRVSFGVFMKPDELIPSTAYIALEMKDLSAVNKYFSLAGMLMAPAQIDGWESALTVNVEEGVDVTLARSADCVLLGLGAPEEYAARASLPAAMSGMPETGVLVSNYISTKFLVDETTALGETIREIIAEEDEDGELADIFEKLSLRSFESISTVQADPERSESRIVWRPEPPKAPETQQQ